MHGSSSTQQQELCMLGSSSRIMQCCVWLPPLQCSFILHALVLLQAAWKSAWLPG